MYSTHLVSVWPIVGKVIDAVGCNIAAIRILNTLYKLIYNYIDIYETCEQCYTVIQIYSQLIVKISKFNNVWFFFWKGWNPWRDLGYRVTSLLEEYFLYYTPYNMYPRISVLVLSKELWSFHSFVSVLQLVCVSIVYCWYLIRVINCEIKISVCVLFISQTDNVYCTYI